MIEIRKTAVDWLVEQVNSDCLNSAFIRPELVRDAKEMELIERKRVGEIISTGQLEAYRNGYIQCLKDLLKESRENTFLSDDNMKVKELLNQFDESYKKQSINE